jgi:hypothetical protein
VTGSTHAPETASSEGGGDDEEVGWATSPVGLPAADRKGVCIIGESIEAETEELTVRVEW